MNRNYWISVGALVVGLLAMTFAGWRFLVHPLAAEYADQIAQKQDLDQQLQTARTTAAQFAKFKAEAENMERTLDFYNARTGGTLNNVQVTELLDGLGNGIGLLDWKASVASQPAIGAAAGVGQFSAHITFHSDFDGLGRFLNACVSQRRIMVPVSVKLIAYADPSGLYKDTTLVDLVLTVYGGQSSNVAVKY